MADFKAPYVNQWAVQVAPTPTDDQGVNWRYPLSAVSGTPTTPTPDGSWALPANLQNSNLSDVTTFNVSGSNPGPSNYIYVSNFNLGIPTSATILGIEVLVTWGPTFTSTTNEESVRLAWGASAANLSPTNNASGAARTPETNNIFGGAADMWGSTSATLTPAVLNATNFGVVYRVQRTSTATGIVVLRGIAVRVTYSMVADGNLRVTQEYAEVLSSAFGAARVTQQYAEVLSHTIAPVRVTQEYAEVLRSITIQSTRPRRMVFF